MVWSESLSGFNVLWSGFSRSGGGFSVPWWCVQKTRLLSGFSVSSSHFNVLWSGFSRSGGGFSVPWWYVQKTTSLSGFSVSSSHVVLSSRCKIIDSVRPQNHLHCQRRKITREIRDLRMDGGLPLNFQKRTLF